MPLINKNFKLLPFLALASFFLDPLLYAFIPSIVAVPGQPFSTGTGSLGVAYSPNGKWLAVGGGSSVSFFSVNTDGSLTEIAGSPVSQPGSDACGVNYSPDNKFLAVANNHSNTVTIFSVDQITGALSASPIITISSQGAGPLQPLYSPNGSFLAVANSFSGSIGMFNVDRETGILDPIDYYLTGGSFNGIATDQIAFSPNGNFLATVNNNSDWGVAIFTVNQSGVLSNQRSYLVPPVNSTFGLAYSPNGDFLAVANHGNTITIFSNNQTTGALTEVSQINTPPLGDGKQIVAFSPDNKFVLVAKQPHNIYVYSINSLGELTLFDNIALLPGSGSFNPSNISFSPIFADGVSFFSTDFTQNDFIFSYAFSLCAPVETPTIFPTSGANFTVSTITPLIGTLSNSASLTLSSSNPDIASVGTVTISDSTWSANITAHALGSVIITATADDCAGNSQAIDATYTIVSQGASIYEAIHAKYFLGKIF